MEKELILVYVTDKSTGTQYRWDSPDSDYICALAGLPEEKFPCGQQVTVLKFAIDSLADVPSLRKQLFDLYGEHWGWTGEG
jgi:hypothetical protein